MEMAAEEKFPRMLSFGPASDAEWTYTLGSTLAPMHDAARRQAPISAFCILDFTECCAIYKLFFCTEFLSFFVNVQYTTNPNSLRIFLNKRDKGYCYLYLLTAWTELVGHTRTKYTVGSKAVTAKHNYLDYRHHRAKKLGRNAELRDKLLYFLITHFSPKKVNYFTATSPSV